VKGRLQGIRVLLALLKPYWLLVVVMAAVALAGSVAEGLGAGLIVPLIEDPGAGTLDGVPLLNQFGRAVEGMDFGQRVRWVAVALVILAVIRGTAKFLSALLSFRLRVKVEGGLREQTFRQLMEVELRYIYKRTSGDLIATVNSYPRDVGEIVRAVGNTLPLFLTVAVYATLMFLLSWSLTLVAIALLLLISGILRRFVTVRVRRSARRVYAAIKRLHSIGIEHISAIKLVHLFYQQARGETAFAEAVGEYQGQIYQRSWLVGLVGPLFSTLNIAVLAVLLIASTYFLLPQSGSWQALIALFVVIMYRLMAPAVGLNQTRASISGKLPSLTAIREFLRTDNKPYLVNGKQQASPLRERLAFEDVSFRYYGETDIVLDHISFDIRKNQMTAIVGPSGSGKTTIADLACRLYDCTEGRIALDGTDIRDLDLRSWRSKIGVVTQDTVLLNATVAENLRFAKEDATQEEIERAVRSANAYDFIAALPKGFDTRLGDRGVGLSGGERQRLCIARALLADPELLVLDEATSNLDSESEALIQQAVERARENRTVLVIAHRLSTVRRADHVVVLQAGRVVEQGDHSLLVKKQGYYYKAVQMQSFEPHDGEVGWIIG